MAINRNLYNSGRLTAKPTDVPVKNKIPSGLHPLKLAAGRDGFIYVPKDYDAGHPVPLAVMLHGAGGVAEHGMALLRDYADLHNFLLLAPASREQSWDIISSDAFDLDVIFLDQALSLCFERFSVDPSRIAIGGFSDGASYALSLGLSNGDLFSHIIAFSPGFAYTVVRKGNPALFISHGIQDTVLPIDVCSRRLVPKLRGQGLSLTYREFDGAHVVPASISRDATIWFLGIEEKKKQ